MVEEQTTIACQPSRVERVLHDQEHVHVLRFRLVRDERPEYHEACQMAGRSGDTMNARHAKGEGFSLRGPDAELVENFVQGRAVHTVR